MEANIRKTADQKKAKIAGYEEKINQLKASLKNPWVPAPEYGKMIEEYKEESNWIKGDSIS